MIALNIKADLRPLQRAFIDLRAKQVPFATALALTTLAKGVQQVEREEVLATFATPTPFTQNAFAVKPATKTNQIATVFAKDIQAAYLEPYVDGGMRSLGGKRGMLVPRDVGTNAYGNLPKAALARLKGKPGVFIGPVTTKAGRVINGVWQRPTQTRAGKRGKDAQAKPAGHLKLLIQFEDTTEAPKHLDFYGRAHAYIRRNAASAFNDAMVRALATARR